MKRATHLILSVLALTVFVGVRGASASPTCLTNPTDAVGASVFGATVQTFINAGVDPNVACIENALWTDPTGFGLGAYVKGAEGWGAATDPTSLGAYDGSGNAADNANKLDFKWVQDTSANLQPSGGSNPSDGIIWNLGGQANQAAVFVFVDHGPVPNEVLENTAWLGNDPNGTNASWTQAHLTHVYGYGWSPDPNVADGFVAVYTLPNPTDTFQYVSVTWGGPAAIQHDGDNEIDAVGGLTAQGTGVNPVPEPGSLILFATGLVGVITSRRRS